MYNSDDKLKKQDYKVPPRQSLLGPFCVRGLGWSPAHRRRRIPFNKSPPTFCVRGLAGALRCVAGHGWVAGPVSGAVWPVWIALANTKSGPATTTCHQPALFRALIVSLPYFACMIASIALMAALRRPFSSREATPLMVVPPGEHTASLSTAGCLPVSTAILPVPAIICPASW